MTYYVVMLEFFRDEEVKVSYMKVEEIGTGTFEIVFHGRLFESRELVTFKKTSDDPKVKVSSRSFSEFKFLRSVLFLKIIMKYLMDLRLSFFTTLIDPSPKIAFRI